MLTPVHDGGSDAGNDCQFHTPGRCLRGSDFVFASPEQRRTEWRVRRYSTDTRGAVALIV